MGSNRYKVTYKCECGCDYGSCGKRSFYLFNYNRSVDIGSLFHKSHADDPTSELEHMGAFGDESIAALIKILTQNHEETERWDETDHKEYEKCKYGNLIPPPAPEV